MRACVCGFKVAFKKFSSVASGSRWAADTTRFPCIMSFSHLFNYGVTHQDVVPAVVSAGLLGVGSTRCYYTSTWDRPRNSGGGGTRVTHTEQKGLLLFVCMCVRQTGCPSDGVGG